MKAFITKASDYDHEEVKEFNTLMDLLNYVKKNGSIIVSKAHSWDKERYGADFDIVIYDDYIE